MRTMQFCSPSWLPFAKSLVREFAYFEAQTERQRSCRSLPTRIAGGVLSHEDGKEHRVLVANLTGCALYSVAGVTRAAGRLASHCSSLASHCSSLAS